MNMQNTPSSHCGYVAIIGRPNVGKSTLLNHLIGQKISITSRKPQTTRHRVVGIKTTGDNQIIYVDTPGLHRRADRAMNRTMNKVASDVIHDVDMIVFVVEGLEWREEDERVLDKLENTTKPVILVVNKVDKISDKILLEAHLAELKAQFNFAASFLVSAKQGYKLDVLEEEIIRLIPHGPHLYPEDQITDRSLKFLSAELIREKLFRETGEELPYSMTIDIEKFVLEKNDVFHISAIILVEKDSQKKIVIGKKGEKLKTIGQQARIDIEKLLDKKVFLQLWVKVKSGWADDERALRNLGYGE